MLGQFVDFGFNSFTRQSFFGTEKRAEMTFAVAPKTYTWLGTLNYPFIACGANNNASGANQHHYDLGVGFIRFLLVAGEWKPELISNFMDHIQTNPFINAPGHGIGDVRISDDGLMVVSGSSQGLVAEYLPLDYSPNGPWGTTNDGDFDLFLSADPVLGVEVTKAPNGNYRIFYSTMVSGNSKIYEIEYNPIANTSTTPIALHAQVGIATLTRDQFGRIHWVGPFAFQSKFYTYTPGTSPGSGVKTGLPISLQRLTNKIYPFPVVHQFVESYDVPYVQQGVPFIIGQAINTNCCVASRDYHWDNTDVTTLGVGSVVSNQVITIEGTFVVDQDFTLSDCDVYMRPNSRIVVNPDVHFQVLSSKIQACKDMWDGIYLSDPTAMITVRNPIANAYKDYFIKHAKDGIVVKNDAQFRLINANLLENYRHLQVLNGTTHYSNSIFQSRFGCQLSGIGRYPHVNDRTTTAITVQNLSRGIELGTNGVIPAADINSVYGAVIGLRIENTTTDLNNFAFWDIANVGAFAWQSSNGVPEVRTAFTNTFKNMPFGIVVLGSLGTFNVDLSGNQMDKISNTGIYVFKCNMENNVLIHGNTIQNPGSAGIWVNQTHPSRVEIEVNTISSSASNVWGNTGIYINEPFAPATQLNQPASLISIYNNTVSNFFSGIFVVNSLAPQIELNTVKINTFLKPNGRGAGILAYACPWTQIVSNQALTSTGTYVGSKIGVGVEYSAHCDINQNKVTNIAEGIWVGGNSWQTEYNCNDLTNYGRGVVYNYAIVGQQGYPAAPQGNKWFPGGASFAHTYSYWTNASQWQFWAQSGSPTWPVNNQFLSPATQIIPSVATASPQCAHNRLSNLDPVVENLEGFGGWSTDRRTNGIAWARKSMVEDPSYFALGGNYVIFSDSVDTTALANFVNLDIAMKNGDQSTAALIWSTLAPTNAEEALMHQMYGIYFNDFLLGSGILPPSHVMAVDSIDTLVAATRSEVVWLSRSMKMMHESTPIFNWIEDDTQADADGGKSDPTGKMQANEGESALAAGYRVYPVPASKEVTIFVPGDEGVDVQLIHLDGRNVAAYHLNSGENVVDCHSLPKGVYFARIHGKTNTMTTLKIVVQ